MHGSLHLLLSKYRGYLLYDVKYSVLQLYNLKTTTAYGETEMLAQGRLDARACPNAHASWPVPLHPRFPCLLVFRALSRADQPHTRAHSAAPQQLRQVDLIQHVQHTIYLYNIHMKNLQHTPKTAKTFATYD